MSIKGGHWLSTIIFGLAVCLTTPACRTCQEKGNDVHEVSASSDAVRDTISKLHEIIIPEMTFFPPATITDAVDFFKQASRDYDKPGTPPERRGVSFVVHLPRAPIKGNRETADPSAAVAATNSVVPIAAILVRAISLYDALQLVCNVTDMRFRIQKDGIVMIEPKGWSLDEDWCTRSYNIPQALTDSLFGSRAGQASAADPNQVWKAFFDQLGVTGPDFATFEYLPMIGKLRVTNTPENLAIIETVLEEFALRMIEVEMQIHAFRAKDIERLRLAGDVSVEALMALRQKGKAKPVAMATVLTKSGQEACMKAVREVVYPTELLTNGGQTGSNVTSRSVANALIPDNFEMRETGMTLQVVPEVTCGGKSINLMLNPQWVTLEGWESYPADLATGWTHKTLSFKQPVFGVTSFQTQVSVDDGGTVLLGSCSTPDGEWVQVGFLTARLWDVQTSLSDGCLDKAVRERRDVRTGKTKTQGDEPCSPVAQKLRDIVIPEVTFRPPATIIDAMRFFREASAKYDKTEVPEAQRGLNFVLKLPASSEGQTEGGKNTDPFYSPVPVTSSVVSVIPALSARFINLYDSLKLVCDLTGMKFRIRDGIVWIMPMVAPEDALITRFYPVLSALHERMSDADRCRVDDGNRRDWKVSFAGMGVNWPEGASVSYMASIGLLRVTNTQENLDVLEQVLEDISICPVMVEVEMQIHAFSTEDIERLRLTGDVSVEALMTLRKNGKARQVASATVLTKSGQEAVVKSVREVLSPAELDGGQRCSNSMSGDGARSLIPSKFEMREVGMILQVVPEIVATDTSQINVLLNPQWVTLDRWETYPADLASGRAHKEFLFRQPVFRTTSFQTQATVKDGGTVLLGNSSTPDGKWVHVGFLTVRRIIGQSGQPARE